MESIKELKAMANIGEKDGNRPFATVVRFEKKRIVATDGHRMAILKNDLTRFTGHVPVKAIKGIPADCFSSVLIKKMLKTSSIKIDDFPKYEKIVRNTVKDYKNDQGIILDTKKFLLILDECKKMKFDIVRVSNENEELTLGFFKAECGREPGENLPTMSMPSMSAMPHKPAYFQLKYLIDGLKLFVGQKIKFHYETLQAAMMTSKTGKYILMPVRY